MRTIGWLTVGSALLCANLAFAQEAPRPVQVIIGPNGVKVIDPHTGKELPSVITRVPSEAPRAQFAVDLPLDAAHKELLRAIQQHQGNKDEPKLEIRQIELKIVPGPEGKGRVVALQGLRDKERGAGLTTDKKIDLLLKEMSELRHDMHEIKHKLTMGSGQPWPHAGFGGMWMHMQRKGNMSGPGWKHEKGGRDAGKEKSLYRESDMERRFERILREAEELRRELKKQTDKE
jgi:hypothetical protein